MALGKGASFFDVENIFSNNLVPDKLDARNFVGSKRARCDRNDFRKSPQPIARCTTLTVE